MLGKHLKTLFGVSVLILMVAVLMAAWGFPTIVKKQIQKNVMIDNSTEMFERWRKIPMPLEFKVTLFNVTNADEVNKGSKPKLMEVGPYVFDEYRERTVLGYGENDTIEYTLRKTFVFNKIASGGLSLEDEVTVINLSYMAAILSVQEMMPSLVPLINKALEKLYPNLEDSFIRVKVKDFLFDGVFLNCSGEDSTLELVCGKIRTDNIPTMKTTEGGFYFSMFGQMNTTDIGPFSMVRGTKDVHDLGNIISFKGKKQIDKWGDVYCGKLNGSDSTIFPPVTDSQVPNRLYSFEPDICRSLYVELVGKKNIFNISSNYYEMPESALAAKSANPNNKCFCKKNWSANHDGCLIMGLLNLMPCQGGPVIASLPHFYMGSEELLEFIAEGLKPDKDKHNTYAYIDPVTGVVISGKRRLQFNIELRNMKGVPQLETVPTGLFPLLWIEEGATLPPSLINELKQSHTLLGYVECVRWIFLAVAVVLTIGSLVGLLRSGAVPIFPKYNNSVSFILGQSNYSGNGANKH